MRKQQKAMDDKDMIEALTNEVAWLRKENARLTEDKRELLSLTRRLMEERRGNDGQ